MQFEPNAEHASCEYGEEYHQSNDVSMTSHYPRKGGH
jgi:hypothetical protein